MFVNRSKSPFTLRVSVTLPASSSVEKNLFQLDVVNNVVILLQGGYIECLIEIQWLTYTQILYIVQFYSIKAMIGWNGPNTGAHSLHIENQNVESA